MARRSKREKERLREKGENTTSDSETGTHIAAVMIEKSIVRANKVLTDFVPGRRVCRVCLETS